MVVEVEEVEEVVDGCSYALTWMDDGGAST